MKPSAPIFYLKRKAKLLSREENIPLHQALNRIARNEGYRDWSLLIEQRASAPRGGKLFADKLFAKLRPGDLMLIGARRGEGKTLMSVELAVETMKSGNRCVFFTLESTETEVLDRFHAIGAAHAQFDTLFELDCSGSISADYIMTNLASAPKNTMAIVDYLQLLDQKRDNPELDLQIRALKSFAQDRGLIFVFISQIDRSYDPAKKSCPDLHDVRLPNPLDLQLFDKACFMNKRVVRFQAAN